MPTGARQPSSAGLRNFCSAQLAVGAAAKIALPLVSDSAQRGIFRLPGSGNRGDVAVNTQLLVFGAVYNQMDVAETVFGSGL